MRGCVTNKSASEGFYYELQGHDAAEEGEGPEDAGKQDPRVIGAEALDGKIIPKGWQKEMLNAGFAIIHDKILVIDPFSDDCVVVTGSHNLGHKASYNNDENLVIIEGNRSSPRPTRRTCSTSTTTSRGATRSSDSRRQAPRTSPCPARPRNGSPSTSTRAATSGPRSSSSG